jgi:hypothetical protein
MDMIAVMPVLSDPTGLCYRINSQNWYGFVARKTTESEVFVNDLLPEIKSI